MEIKIFVVKTEIENNKKALEYLESQKRNLIRLFNGLTETTNQKGYWINEKGFIETDKVETWQIYVNQNLTEKLEYETVLNKNTEISLNYILFQIKQITQQKTQAYAIDNEICFI
jgi:hypothetical protein